MKLSKTLLLVAFVIFAEGTLCGQQLLVLKQGKVLARFDEGDEIFFQLKDQRQVHHSALQSIREFYFVTVNQDSIPFSRVYSLTFRSEARKKYGAVTMLTGAALLGVYGLNSLAFDEDTQSMRGLRTVGLFGIGFGALIYFTSQSTIKLTGIKRLKYASYDSPLYK